MKKLLKSLLCALLICALLPVSALAAGDAASSPRLRQVMTGMGTLKSVNKTRYLLAQEPKGSLWGVYTTDGTQVMDYLYDSLAYIAYDCFSASSYSKAPKGLPLDYINSHALVTRDGTLLSDFIYGAIKVYNHYWAAGWIVEEADKEDYDYKYDSSHFYKIVRCDILYLGGQAVPGGDRNETAFWYASLDRAQFKTAQGHDHYLSIQDRAGKVTVYDRNFQPLALEPAQVSTAVFTVKNYAVRTPEGSVLLDGFTTVKEANTAEGLRLICTWEDFSGNILNSVFTLAGEMLMSPTPLTISSVAVGYAVVKDGEKAGLYSMAEDRLIVPCRYDEIIPNNTGLDAYVAHGYACGLLEDARYFIDIADGQEKLLYVYDKDLLKVAGGLVYYTDENKQVNLCAANGAISQLPPKYTVTAIRGDGYLIPCKDELHYAVIDWDGERIVYNYSNEIRLTDDNKIILNSTTGGYQLYELIEE
ncbi:MAG: hypothetical protein IJU12_06260 [Clostridia bacterium]|nr:hypothetical protein [Clostridia bacterium]